MRLRLVFYSLLVFGLAACGTVAAEPRPTFEPTSKVPLRVANPLPTATPRTVAEEDGDEEAPMVAVQPSPTPLPPTATPFSLPTAIPSPTPEPTSVPTEAVSESVAPVESAEAGVVVEGFTGDVAAGEFWFNGGVKVSYNNVEWQCSTCHNVAERVPGSGPYLYGIATVAGERVAGQDAVTYLANSILHPNDFIAPAQVGPDGTEFPWAQNVMPNNWNTILDGQMVADLVAYLLSLDQSLD